MRFRCLGVIFWLLAAHFCVHFVTCEWEPRDPANNFQDNVDQQSFESILRAIESRLRNLDLIYQTKLTPTLEAQLGSYQRKLDVLDSQIIRLESIVMLTLDKISENISTKNIKDDIATTNLHRKLDAVYDGLGHRLNYIERKLDSGLQKAQIKMDVILSRIEKLDEAMSTKDTDIATDISETLLAVDSLKSSYSLLEEMLATTKKNTFTLSEDIQNKLTDKLGTIERKLDTYESESKRVSANNLNSTLELVAENNEILKVMKRELKNDLNSYAIKVADMGTSTGRSGDDIHNQLLSISSTLNSTVGDVQKGMRSIMIQIGKLGKSGKIPVDTEDYTKKIDDYFEKVITNQEIFLEGCHRVQMDESQIESEISTTLEKLIDMIHKKGEVEMRDIKNIEKILKTHDNKIYRGLTQSNNNIVSLYETTVKTNGAITADIKRICNDLDALFVIIKDLMENTSEKRNESYINVLLSELGSIKTKLNYLQYEGDNESAENLNEIKQLLVELRQNSSTETKSDVQKIIDGLNNIEHKLNQTYSNFTLHNQNTIAETLEKTLKKHFEMPANIVTTTGSSQELTKEEIEEREKQIANIFGPLINNVTQSNDTQQATNGIVFDENQPIIVENNTTDTTVKCRKNLLDVIDVRSEDDCDEEGDGDVQSTTEVNLIDIRAQT